MHDNLVDCDFTADAATGRTRAAEDKLYMCAINDVWSTRIVGYSIGPRMTAELAVSALSNAVTFRVPAGTIVHSDRASPVLE